MRLSAYDFIFVVWSAQLLLPTQPDLAILSPQRDALARGAHPDFHFGADRHELDELTEDVGDEFVALVPAVEANLVAEQARRHPDANFGAHLSSRGAHRAR